MDEVRDLSNYRIEKARADFFASKILFEEKQYAQSINRSYYAIFHMARALLAFDKFDSKKHTGIISYFDKNYINTGRFDKKFSTIIHDAQRIRTLSDYIDFYVVSREEAEI